MLTDLADGHAAARFPAAGLSAGHLGIGDGSRPEWLEEWLDYCGYAVHGDIVWPKPRKVADEIAMVLASADNPLAVNEIWERLVTLRSPVTIRNRLRDDPRFRPRERRLWTLVANLSETQT